MPEARAVESVTQHWVRCSPDDFGDFVEWLTSLTTEAQASAIEDHTAYLREDLARVRAEVSDHTASSWDSERITSLESQIAAREASVKSRFGPNWQATVRGRFIEATGSLNDVQGEIPLEQIKDFSVGVGSSADAPRFSVTVSRLGGVSVRVSSESSRWLDDHMPQLRNQLRQLSNWWGWLPRQSAMIANLVLCAVVVALGSIGFFAPGVWDPFSIASVSLFPLVLVGFWTIWVPSVRFGPRPSRWWLRALAWIGSVVIAAVLGDAVLKLVGW